MSQSGTSHPHPPLHAEQNGEFQPTVVVVDDEPAVQHALKKLLERADYRVLIAANFEEFTAVMSDCDVVLCDIILSGNNGLQVLKWSREHYPDTPVVMMTGEPSYETASQAIRLGAYDYLAKPIHKEELLTTLIRAMEHRQLKLAKRRLEAENELYRVELERRVADRTRALRESQEFLATLTDTMADVVFSLQMPDYRIEYVNQASLSIFGIAPQELLGQTVAILYPDEASYEVFIRKLKAAEIAGQSQIRMEQLLRHQDGKLVWTEIAITFIRSNEQVVRMISVVRDISERSLLLGVVAHELRGPLALLTGFSEALLGDVESLAREDIANYLNTMHRTATRMLKILNDLLDVTEIDLGRVQLNIEPVDLGEIIRTQSADYDYVARKKNIRFVTKPALQGLTCQGDVIKIGQVLSNLIDNAIKYSPNDTIIEILAEQRGDELWIGVKDQGPGIKPDEIQYLFKSFGHNKISSRPTSGEKSTGLGLAICKKIVEAHHGQIGVETAPGQGATFWFSLPVSAPDTLPPA